MHPRGWEGRGPPAVEAAGPTKRGLGVPKEGLAEPTRVEGVWKHPQIWDGSGGTGGVRGMSQPPPVPRSYRGPSGEVGCYVAPRPLTRDSNYFEVSLEVRGARAVPGGGYGALTPPPLAQVSIVDSGVRGTIAVGLVPHCHSLEHPPGWGPGSVAYHADDGK